MYSSAIASLCLDEQFGGNHIGQQGNRDLKVTKAEEEGITMI